MDPASLGIAVGRRRTPGLRREEVAQRAFISTTWYTWLEQGRGGAPSVSVLDQIARALMLTESEREHLFLIGLGRPASARYAEYDRLSSRLQRVLDALHPTPALLRTASWDVIGWNRAAAALLMQPASTAPEDRNLLRFLFLDARARTIHKDWENTARLVVVAFRIDAVRAGALVTIEPLVQDLCQKSPVFRRLWNSNDLSVLTASAPVVQLEHPFIGALRLEYSAFAVDGRNDLILAVYNPATLNDAKRIESSLPASESMADADLSPVSEAGIPC